MRRLILILCLVAAVVGVAVGGRSLFAADTSKPAADPHGPPITVVVPKGVDASQIATILQKDGVISDASRFRGYAKSQGEGSSFRAGTYEMEAGIDWDIIFQKLDAGPPAAAARKLVVPEGFRNTQIAALLPSVGISPGAWTREVRRASPPPGFGHHLNMEGFMFPATYTIAHNETARQLVDQELQAFSDNFAQVDMSYARSKNLTPYDVLTIASMVEREARTPGDRGKVASVIYNRLHAGMKLGIDATILYHLGSWTAPIHESDILSLEPYNTRQHLGLPPTPICNPGLAALQAAAHPDHTNYLYYVAVPGQSAQYFTSSYADFKAHGG
ncbi:MAG: endolytic transglycosylase MltG [Gaiellales bacterium]